VIACGTVFWQWTSFYEIVLWPEIANSLIGLLVF